MLKAQIDPLGFSSTCPPWPLISEPQVPLHVHSEPSACPPAHPPFHSVGQAPHKN